MKIKLFIKLMLLAILGLFAWTCNVSGPAQSDTLTLHLDDSLKASIDKYDSLEIDLYTVNGEDTVFRKTLFAGPYENPDSLVDLSLGNPPVKNFVIVLRGYKDGEKVLELRLPFVQGHAGQPALVYLAPPDSNHAPVLSLQNADTGVSLRIKEARKLAFRVTATDPDSGNKWVFLKLSNPPWPACGQGRFDTATGEFDFTPSFRCVSSGESSLADIQFQARDNGQPIQTGHLTVGITVQDSNSAPRWQTTSLSMQGKEGLAMSRALASYFLGDAEGDSVSFIASFGVLDSGLRWSWSPGFRDSGQKVCEITATDNHILPFSSHLSLTLTIADSVSALTVIIASPADGYLTRDSTVPVQWTVGGVNQNAQTTESLKEGANKIKRTFRDSLGNVGGDSITVIRDNTPPGKPTVRGPSLTNNPRPQWTWKTGGDGNGQYRVKLDNSNLTAGTTAVNDTLFIPVADLTHGRHVLHVQERDAAGNWSVSDSAAVQVDLVKPDVKITSPADGHVINLASLQVQWTVDGQARPVKTVTLAEGSTTITVDSTDPAGNKGTASIKVTRRANVIFVNSALTANGDGNSWATAFKTLQSALGSAKGTEIWVAKGSYRPDQGVGKDSNFVLRANVAMYGGFIGSEDSLGKRDWKLNETILTGEKGDTTLEDNMGPVVIGANQAILDGFTVERGYASLGGGMYNFKVTSQILNCLFRGNGSSADFGGGAMYNNTCTPRIQGCIFLRNKALDGGGLVNESASPTIIDCIFQENQADNGGAIVNTTSSFPSINTCVFVNNHARQGGAIWDRNGFSTNVNLIFMGNSADYYGGAIVASASDLSLKNCIFSTNSSGTGGGIKALNSTLSLINCTFFGNVSSDSGGGIFFQLFDDQIKKSTIRNTILWGNTTYHAGPQLAISTSTATSSSFILDIDHSDVLGGQTAITKLGPGSVNMGVGNIDINPVFKNSANPIGPDGKFFTADDGLNIQSGPCINSGNPDTAHSTDITSAPRIQGGQVDMGAYEN